MMVRGNPRNIRVAFLTRDYPPTPGGISTYVRNLEVGLRKLGVGVTIFVGKTDPKAVLTGLERRLREYDIIHVHSPAYGLFAPRPFVITVQAPIRAEYSYYSRGSKMKAGLGYPFERIAFARSSHIIAVSQVTRDDLVRYYGIPRSKITVVDSGVDHDRFTPVRHPLNNPPRIVMCSRLDKRKNIPQALRGLARLRDRPFELSVIGDGPERYRLELMARGLGLRCLFLGSKAPDEIAQYYKSSDVYLTSSYQEGFGLTLVEAMASGCAVVASDIPAHRERIPDGTFGLIFAGEEDLAYKLDLLLSNPDLLEQLRARAVERSLKYSWDLVAAETLQVYQEIMEEFRAGTAK